MAELAQLIEKERQEWTQIGRNAGFNLAYWQTATGCLNLDEMRNKVASFIQRPKPRSLASQAEDFATYLRENDAAIRAESPEQREARFAKWTRDYSR